MSLVQPIATPTPLTHPTTALFVDGENLSPTHAGRILMALGPRTALGLARVYGDMARGVWPGATGLRLVHSGGGKNAADMLICIEAMAAWHTGRYRRIAIATSDRDFSHLALWLREAGAEVIGLGCAKAPAALRHACSRWVELVVPEAAQPVQAAICSTPPKIAPQKATLEDVLLAALAKGPLTISQVNTALQGCFQISKTPERNWARWFAARSHLFQLDGKGDRVRVRLTQTRSTVTRSLA